MSANQYYYREMPSYRQQEPRQSARLSESYLHTQRVQSQNRKHAPVVQMALYGFILCALVFGVLQVVRAVGTNVYKLSVLTGNRAVIGQFHQDIASEQALLRKKIEIYSSPAGIEELARNNLDMVAPEEILIRLQR